MFALAITCLVIGAVLGVAGTLLAIWLLLLAVGDEWLKF